VIYKFLTSTEKLPVENEGTWARVEKELKDYFDSFSPPNSALRKRHVENLQHQMKPLFDQYSDMEAHKI
jgi:hypothetical protein